MRLGSLVFIPLVLFAGCTLYPREPAWVPDAPPPAAATFAPAPRAQPVATGPLCPRLDLTPDAPAFLVGTRLRIVARLVACPDEGLVLEAAPCGGHVRIVLPTWDVTLLPGGGAARSSECARALTARTLPPGGTLEETFHWDGTVPTLTCVEGACRDEDSPVVTAWFPIRASARAGDLHAFHTVGELQPYREEREATDEDRPSWSLRWSPARIEGPLGSRVFFDVDVIPRRGTPAPIVASGAAAFGGDVPIPVRGMRLTARATIGLTDSASFSLSSDGLLRVPVPGPELSVREPRASEGPARDLPCATLRLLADRREVAPGGEVDVKVIIESCAGEDLQATGLACDGQLVVLDSALPSRRASCEESPGHLSIPPHGRHEATFRMTAPRSPTLDAWTLGVTARIGGNATLQAVLPLRVVAAPSTPAEEAHGWSVAFAPSHLRGFPGEVLPFALRIVPPAGTGAASLSAAEGLAVSLPIEIPPRGREMDLGAVARHEASVRVPVHLPESRETFVLPGPTVDVEGGAAWLASVEVTPRQSDAGRSRATWANGSLVVRIDDDRSAIPCHDDRCQVFVRETPLGIEIAFMATRSMPHAARTEDAVSTTMRIDRLPREPVRVAILEETRARHSEASGWIVRELPIEHAR